MPKMKNFPSMSEGGNVKRPGHSDPKAGQPAGDGISAKGLPSKGGNVKMSEGSK